jgi:putative permease
MTHSDFLKHAAAAVLTVIALLALWTAGSAVAIFLASLAVAAALHPPVENLKERGWPATIAAGFVAGACALVVAVLCLALAGPLLANLRQLDEDVSLAMTAFSDDSPEHWLVKMTNSGEAASGGSLALLGELLPSLVGTASNLVQLSAMSGICLALAFYWTIDRERFVRLWLSLIPVRRRVGAQRVWQAMEREVGAYMRSEIVQFFLAVLLLWLIFLVLDLRYAALAALVAGSLTLIPWLGTLFAAAVVMILTSPKLVAWEAAWVSPQGWAALGAIVLVLCFLEFIVEPRLFQRERYNPLWTALTAIFMASMWGFWGLIFGPMVGYVLQIFVRQLYPRLIQEQSPVTDASVLHERLARLESSFAEQAEVPPELLSLKQRLLEIVVKRNELQVRDA